MPKLHFARGEVGDHDRQAAVQIFRFIGRLDAGEDIAGFAADIQGQLQEFVGAFDMFGLDDPRDAQVDLGEISMVIGG